MIRRRAKRKQGEPSERSKALDLIETILANYTLLTNYTVSNGQTQVPSLNVREIVDLANGRLPTTSKTPANIVHRALALDIKEKGDESRFIRTNKGRFALRRIVEAQ